MKVRRRLKLIELHDGCCFYCGQRASEASRIPDDFATIDEVVPRSKGGRCELHNQVLACLPCNLMKGGRMPTAIEIERLNARNALLTEPAPSAIIRKVIEELEDMDYDD
jgi:5-methylcytosine-specific restriction endonuclease McrA